MGESTKAADAVDKLVRAVGGKFTGLKYDVWKRTAQSVISMRHSGISDILEGRPCPEPIHIRPRPSSMASRPTRAVTRSQVVDETASQPATGGSAPVGSSSTTQHGTGETPAADMEPSSPRTPTAQGADIQPVTAAAESSSFPVSASVLWSTDDNISNIDDIQTWHRDNRLLYDFLFLSTSGAAASFLLKFKPKQKGYVMRGGGGLDVRRDGDSRSRRSSIITMMRMMASPLPETSKSPPSESEPLPQLVYRETTKRSFVKALSWRLTAGVVTLISGLVFSGSLSTAMSIVGSDFVTKSGFMFAGERLWNKMKWGKGEKGDSTKRSLAKAVLWRVFAASNTLICGVFLAKDLSIASKIAGTDTIFKTALFFLNERMWNSIQWGKEFEPEYFI